MSSVPSDSAKRTLILIGHSYWCRQKSRTGCHHKAHYNVNLISETYKDTATGKLQVPPFQPPHSSLTTVVPEKPSIIVRFRRDRKLLCDFLLGSRLAGGLSTSVSGPSSLHLENHGQSHFQGRKK